MPGGDLQYDVSPREKRLVEDRARLRASLRAEYVKNMHSPYNYLKFGDGGYMFDPAMQRWISMRAQHWHFFKPTPQTAFWPCMIMGSIIGAALLFKWDRDGKERKYRAGLVSYRDRDFKFI